MPLTTRPITGSRQLGKPLYQVCPACQGSGELAVITAKGGPYDPPLRRCPACRPLRVVPVGLTLGQVEDALDRLKAAEARERVDREGTVSWEDLKVECALLPHRSDRIDMRVDDDPTANPGEQTR